MEEAQKVVSLSAYRKKKQMQCKRSPKTLNYICGGIEGIKAGEKYYFGQLVKESEDLEELLESGIVKVYDSNRDDHEIVEFVIVKRDDDILKTIVQVTGLY